MNNFDWFNNNCFRFNCYFIIFLFFLNLNVYLAPLFLINDFNIKLIIKIFIEWSNCCMFTQVKHYFYFICNCFNWVAILYNILCFTLCLKKTIRFETLSIIILFIIKLLNYFNMKIFHYFLVHYNTTFFYSNISFSHLIIYN